MFLNFNIYMFGVGKNKNVIKICPLLTNFEGIEKLLHRF